MLIQRIAVKSNEKHILQLSNATNVFIYHFVNETIVTE